MRSRKALLFALVTCLAVAWLTAYVVISVHKNNRERAHGELCTKQLWQIDSAMEQAALSLHLRDSDTLTEAQITPYLAGQRLPKCPSGGTYTIRDLRSGPVCSLRKPDAHGSEREWHNIYP